MMFSATLPKETLKLARDFMDASYMSIQVGQARNPCPDVKQRFLDVSRMTDNEKIEALVQQTELVRGPGGQPPKTIIFANSKQLVKEIAYVVNYEFLPAVVVHGDLSQEDRAQAIADMRSGRASTLVATQVAARGLDIPGIDHVVSYQLPRNWDDYVHRIGRTGRAGNSGLATTFVDEALPVLKDIVRISREAAEEGQCVVPQWLEERAAAAPDPEPRKQPGRGGPDLEYNSRPDGKGLTNSEVAELATDDPYGVWERQDPSDSEERALRAKRARAWAKGARTVF